MLSHWTQEEKKQFRPVKTHYQRMLDYRETLLAELDRLNYHLKELEHDKQKSI